MHALIVVDLGYGDAGKGSLTDYLVREYGARTVVRYNGGAQAAHNVVLPDGRHHTFAQFGSGTFVPGVITYLSEYMIVNPVNIFAEEEHLDALGVRDAFQRLVIHPEALITTPFHVAANRLKEIHREDRRHGSCGLGIAQTVSQALATPDDVIRAKHLNDKSLRLKLEKTQRWQRELIPRELEKHPEARCLFDPGEIERCAEIYRTLADLATIEEPPRKPGRHHPLNGTVIFEGAQGVLLDQDFGIEPYRTWSKTTTVNAEAMCTEGDEVYKLGVIRAYMTRHGPGPFITENRLLGEELEETLNSDAYNGFNEWQRSFRYGYTDLVALHHALFCTGGVDTLAVTCLDQIASFPNWKVCEAYNCGDPLYRHISTEMLCDVLAESLATSVTIESRGPTYEDKRLVATPDERLSELGAVRLV